MTIQRDAGLVEVLDAPEGLRPVGREGLAGLSFLTGNFDRAHAAAR
jgi:hypothetical protein